MGKKADFTILDTDPLEIEPELIKDIQVVGLVFNGNWVRNK